MLNYLEVCLSGTRFLLGKEKKGNRYKWDGEVIMRNIQISLKNCQVLSLLCFIHLIFPLCLTLKNVGWELCLPKDTISLNKYSSIVPRVLHMETQCATIQKI
jgi:hypothetical protein